MSKQIYNPYMPSFEYVPDGEPHLFGGRIYLYGSHDRFDGAEYCLNDYVCYSADVKDLTDCAMRESSIERNRIPGIRIFRQTRRPISPDSAWR